MQKKTKNAPTTERTTITETTKQNKTKPAQPYQPQRSAQILPPPQPKNTPTQVMETPLSPTLPSLSPISTPRLLSRAHLETREQPATLASSLRKRTKSASKEVRQPVNGYYFCTGTLETSTIDHHLKKSLKHLISFKTINDKDITNSYLFRGAPIVTTFVRSAGNRTRDGRVDGNEAPLAEKIVKPMYRQSPDLCLPVFL